MSERAPQRSCVRLSSVIPAVTLLLVAGCQSSGPLPSQSTAAAPKRIVSLVPALTEMLFAIGAGPEVAGVSSFDRYPPEVETRPRVGALVDPDLERILALRPDLVLTYATQDDLKRQLERAGIPIFDYRHGGLADVTTTIVALGDRVGHGAEGRRVSAEIDRQIEAIRTRVVTRLRLRVLLVFGRDPDSLRNIYASGGVGFLNDMLIAAGGDNVLSDIRRESVQVTTELALARAPDVILEIRSADSPGSVAAEADMSAWRALAATPAVRANRLLLLRDDALVVPGPRVGRGVEHLAQALHPDAFPP